LIGQRWDEIAGIFSRDAVLKGAFDKFAESTKAKRGTADVSLLRPLAIVPAGGKASVKSKLA